MSSNPRVVMVDDTDNSIDYQGLSWFTDWRADEQFGTYGPAYGLGQHGTRVSSSLSYSFTGTSVAVYGANDRSQPGISWNCYVDGESLKTDGYSDPRIACQKDSIADGQHTLKIEAVITQGATFWLDHIRYTASQSANIENATVYMDGSDPGIKYGDGWTLHDGYGYLSNAHNSTLDVEFTGVHMAWYTFNWESMRGSDAEASYTIDGSPSQGLNIKGNLNTNTTFWNQLMFQTPILSKAKHKVSFRYNGDNSTVPLSVGYFIVQKGPSAESPIPTSSASPVAPTIVAAGSTISSDSSVVLKKITAASVVTGVSALIIIGGIILGAILLLRPHWLRRFRRVETPSTMNVGTAGSPVLSQNSWIQRSLSTLHQNNYSTPEGSQIVTPFTDSPSPSGQVNVGVEGTKQNELFLQTNHQTSLVSPLTSLNLPSGVLRQINEERTGLDIPSSSDPPPYILRRS